MTSTDPISAAVPSSPPPPSRAIPGTPVRLAQPASTSIHQSPHQHNPPSPTGASPGARKKTRLQYGDRYIPNRNGINLQAAFSLAQDHDSAQKDLSRTTPKVKEIGKQKLEDADKTFGAVLKAEIFGSKVPGALPSTSAASVKLNTGPSSGTGSNAYLQEPVTPPRSTRSAPGSSSNGSNNMFRYRAVNVPKTTYTSSSTASTLLENDFPPTPSTRRRSPPRQRKDTASLQDENAIVAQYATPTRSPPRIAHHEGIDPNNEIYSLSPVRLESQRLLLSPRKEPRGIAKIPYKVLDAPELVDDFYLNLVDWGSQNTLGVGLGSCVYLWHAQTSSVNKLCDLNDDLVTSVSWIKRGTHLAVGTKKGLVQIWDAEKCKRIRTMTGHDMRAGALAWNEHLLSSGSRDRSILHRDVRIPEHYIKRLTGHRQEVCGLKWNVEENQLASGGNDNRLVVWDGLNDAPLYKFTDHKAAVKAIAWSPHQRGLLATGGGTADKRIRFWNTLTGTCLSEIDTGSQVCNLAWSKTSNELVSTHGYSKNQVVIWKYPSMQQVAALTGHSYRVLYLAMSPDGRTIVTGAGDETLRFWSVFGGKENKGEKSLLDVFPQLR